MTSLYRRLYDLRCPACQTLQAPFSLSMTFKGGLSPIRFTDGVPCPSCGTRLRLVAIFGQAATLGLQIATGALTLAVVGVFLIVVFPLLLSLLGFWIVLLLPFILFGLTMLGAALRGTLGPLYYEVQTL